jgi:ankyrin repeat protein
LLTYGSNVNSVDTYGNTALHYACLGDCLKVVARLLETEGLDMTLLNFEKKPVFEMTTN